MTHYIMNISELSLRRVQEICRSRFPGGNVFIKSLHSKETGKGYWLCGELRKT